MALLWGGGGYHCGPITAPPPLIPLLRALPKSASLSHPHSDPLLPKSTLSAQSGDPRRCPLPGAAPTPQVPSRPTKGLCPARLCTRSSA